MATIHIIVITCLFMVGDIVSGFIKAWRDHDIQSQALRRGLFHKVAFGGVIFLAKGLEWAADEIPEIQLNMPITSAICAYIILTEIVSILENLKAINPDIGGIANRFPGHDADVGRDETVEAAPAEHDDGHVEAA